MSAAAKISTQIKVKLTVVQGPHAGQIFQLSKPFFTIGRGPENDVVLNNDPQISRSHAKVFLIDQDFEIQNTSSKNSVVVNGESVQKWKLMSNTNFLIGESEFKIEYEIGKAQASVQVPVKQNKPKPKANVVPLKAKAPLQNRAQKPMPPPAMRPSVPAQNGNRAPMMNPNMPPAMRGGAPPQAYVGPMGGAIAPSHMNGMATAKTVNVSFTADPKFKFYLIGIIAIVALYFYLGDTETPVAAKINSTLAYQDEVDFAAQSLKAKELEKEREAKLRQMKSNMKMRVEENFVRGMRDFQLGNYARAEDSFQVVLGTDPDHQLARRYRNLAKVRFDEVVQEKIMLGDSYFKKHNFRMCASLHRQVIDMLQGRDEGQQLKNSEKKAKECELAEQGIR